MSKRKNHPSSSMEEEAMNCNDTPKSNHDLAIRRFCPARLEQEQLVGGGGDYYIYNYNYNSSFEEEGEEGSLMINDINDLLYDPYELRGDVPPHLAASDEVDQLVDSFINADHYQEEVMSGSSMDSSPYDHHHFLDEMEAFSNILGDVFVDVPMEEGGGDEIINGSLADDRIIIMDNAPSEITQEGDQINQNIEGIDQGLQLVHLLLACAEAVGCRDSQLADSILGQIWASANPWGDSLQRVSYCFAAGLRSRLSLLNNVNANGTFTNGGVDAHLPYFTREEKMEASQLLYQSTPFVAFGFLAANEAICQAAQGKDLIHVIDLGMEHTLQWPSLIRNLASRPEGQPRLRITGLINEESRSDVEGSMKVLVEDAASLGVPVEFNLISEQVSPALFTREKLDLQEGEALFVNSIMHLHKFVKESRGSLKAILQAIKKLGPALLTVVEQDANHNGPFFLGRFLESLHYYSAIFDSLEASLPRNSLQRMKIEKIHFAEEIRNIVACEGGNRIERHERADQWRRQLGRAGYQVVGLKCMSQARMMLSVYGCDGYTLASEKGCLLLGWKGRPIMLASAWKVHSSASASSS